jgi:SNF2 family DNA or RNA helicase
VQQRNDSEVVFQDLPQPKHNSVSSVEFQTLAFTAAVHTEADRVHSKTDSIPENLVELKEQVNNVLVEDAQKELVHEGLVQEENVREENVREEKVCEENVREEKVCEENIHEQNVEEVQLESLFNIEEWTVQFPIQDFSPPKFAVLEPPKPRDVRLLNQSPWTRTLGKIDFSISTEGWKFPQPPADLLPVKEQNSDNQNNSGPNNSSGEVSVNPAENEQTKPTDQANTSAEQLPEDQSQNQNQSEKAKQSIRPKPTRDAVLFKDRLLYLLQPPIDNIFDGRQLGVPFPPFPYQLEGIAFLMPRNAALLADEMGLGKTMQTILTLRLMFHQGLIRKALLITPKPLVFNWARELKLWAPDLPFEVFEGDVEQRRRTWFVSNCPLKLINYETLTRDVDFLSDPRSHFDIVVLDEAQRIKNKESKTAQVVRSIRRERSWALTGTPVENRTEDLANIFSFCDPNRIPPETPPKRMAQLTADSILRRTKEMVQSDMPAKMIQDLSIELSPAQQYAYDRAEKDGIVHLNELGETITVQHVFQLVMRLKQICNFDPLTGESAKLDRIVSDMEEVSASGRKAIIFSQWVEPLEKIAAALQPHGPLMYHGRIPQPQRVGILDEFKSNPDKHVILMTYGTGSVGLNLQFTNYVFLFDRWWNPAIEDQAINRAHRIGQKYPVNVTRFASAGTIEARIHDVLEAKRKLFNDLIANADKPSQIGLSEDELFGLFDINVRPKRSAA